MCKCTVLVNYLVIAGETYLEAGRRQWRAWDPSVPPFVFFSSGSFFSFAFSRCNLCLCLFVCSGVCLCLSMFISSLFLFFVCSSLGFSSVFLLSFRVCISLLCFLCVCFYFVFRLSVHPRVLLVYSQSPGLPLFAYP